MTYTVLCDGNSRPRGLETWRHAKDPPESSMGGGRQRQQRPLIVGRTRAKVRYIENLDNDLMELRHFERELFFFCSLHPRAISGPKVQCHFGNKTARAFVLYRRKW